MFTCSSKKLPAFFTKYQFRFHIPPLYYVMYSGGTREPNELQTSSFFTSFISLQCSAPVESGRCFPSAFMRSRKSETFCFFRYYPLFLPYCPLPGPASPAVRQTKNNHLCLMDFLRCAKVFLIALNTYRPAWKSKSRKPVPGFRIFHKEMRPI